MIKVVVPCREDLDEDVITSSEFAVRTTKGQAVVRDILGTSRVEPGAEREHECSRVHVIAVTRDVRQRGTVEAADQHVDSVRVAGCEVRVATVIGRDQVMARGQRTGDERYGAKGADLACPELLIPLPERHLIRRVCWLRRDRAGRQRGEAHAVARHRRDQTSRRVRAPRGSGSRRDASPCRWGR